MLFTCSPLPLPPRLFSPGLSVLFYLRTSLSSLPSRLSCRVQLCSAPAPAVILTQLSSSVTLHFILPCALPLPSPLLWTLLPLELIFCFSQISPRISDNRSLVFVSVHLPSWLHFLLLLCAQPRLSLCSFVTLYFVPRRLLLLLCAPTRISKPRFTSTCIWHIIFFNTQLRLDHVLWRINTENQNISEGSHTFCTHKQYRPLYVCLCVCVLFSLKEMLCISIMFALSASSAMENNELKVYSMYSNLL